MASLVFFFILIKVFKLRFWLFHELKVVPSEKKKKQFCVPCTADKFLFITSVLLGRERPSSTTKGQKAHNVFVINFGISEERASLSLLITSLNKYPRIHISPAAPADTIFIFKKATTTTTRLYYLLAWAASVKKKKKQHPFTASLETLLSLCDFTASVVALHVAETLRRRRDSVSRRRRRGEEFRSVSGPAWARTMAPFQHV